MINELFVTDKVKVSDLVPRLNNPRKIKAEEKRKLWERIQKFGLISIPVRDADNTILGGKQRCELLLQYGMGDMEIDVRTATRKLSEDELREVMIIENSHAGEWDLQKLKEEFESFVDLDDFGIMMDGLDEAVKDLIETEEPEMPIVAKFSEKYSSVVILCTNELDENHVFEKLGIDRGKCYKSNNVGLMKVVNAKTLIESWK
jgi:hypothetical protein